MDLEFMAILTYITSIFWHVSCRTYQSPAVTLTQHTASLSMRTQFHTKESDCPSQNGSDGSIEQAPVACSQQMKRALSRAVLMLRRWRCLEPPYLPCQLPSWHLSALPKGGEACKTLFYVHHICAATVTGQWKKLAEILHRRQKLADFYEGNNQTIWTEVSPCAPGRFFLSMIPRLLTSAFQHAAS